MPSALGGQKRTVIPWCCPDAVVTEGSEPLRGCWESSLGHLQEQQMLLTTKPSL